MLEKLKNLLAAPSGPTRLTETKPDLKVAVSAVLLEMANADGEFDPSERETIVVLLRDQFDMGAAEVEDLIALTEAERAKVPDLWPFTNAIARTYTPEEKLEVLVMVWQVVFADSRLDPHEEMLVRKLQLMLAVNHSVVIEAKTSARAAGPVA